MCRWDGCRTALRRYDEPGGGNGSRRQQDHQEFVLKFPILFPLWKMNVSKKYLPTSGTALSAVVVDLKFTNVQPTLSIAGLKKYVNSCGSPTIR